MKNRDKKIIGYNNTGFPIYGKKEVDINEYDKKIKKKKIGIKGIVICLIITFLYGLLFSYDYYFRIMPLSIKILKISLWFLPFIIFFIVSIIILLSIKNKKNYLTASTSEAIGFVFGIILIHFIFSSIFSITDSLDYPGINSQYYRFIVSWYELKVFPKKIPSNAENVKLIDYAAPSQGGATTSLYYVDKKMTWNKFDNKYRNNSIWIGKYKESSKKCLTSGTFYNTPAYDNNSDNYLIYLVDCKCDKSGYCNHGKRLFAAYNEKTHEVIYKHDQW